MAITKEQIWLVADEMREAGESPTLAAVRKKIGGGSFTTISEAIKEWRQRAQEKARTDELVVPNELRDLVAGAGKAFWQSALEQARAEVEGLKIALESREKEIARERVEALALADQMSADLEQAQAEIAQLKAELIQAQAEAREVMAVSAEREQRLQILERDLKEQRESAAKEFHVERDARADAEKQAERLNTEMEARQREIDRMKEEYRKQFQKFNVQVEAVKAKLQASEEGRAAVVIENVRLQERTDGLGRQLEFLQSRLSDLTGRKEDLPKG